MFRTSAAPDVVSEWLVAVDAQGALHALRSENRREFPETLQAELAFQELLGSHSPRVLRVEEFHLIAIRYLDQPAQAPGPNDPVNLYGTLFGPYRATQDSAIESVDGQLTLTRADVLDALLHAAPRAFRYPAAAGGERAAPRCLHMMLPADREDAIARGHGAVLAYALMPPALMSSDAGNEVLASQTLYELLSALKQDLRKEGLLHHPLCETVLPVPSRPMLERQLEAEGYTIAGDEAVKQATGSSGFTGFLASVFGANEKRLTLPPEGQLEDFLRLAHVTLSALAGWPTPRIAALRRRLDDPRPPDRPIPKATLAGAVTLPRPADPGEISTRVPPPKPPNVWKNPRDRSRPDWMDDFERQNVTPRAEPKRAARRPPDKPHWMKDFD